MSKKKVHQVFWLNKLHKDDIFSFYADETATSYIRVLEEQLKLYRTEVDNLATKLKNKDIEVSTLKDCIHSNVILSSKEVENCVRTEET